MGMGFTFPFNNLTIENFFPNGEAYAAIQRGRAAMPVVGGGGTLY
jgi:hypothetical protein